MPYAIALRLHEAITSKIGAMIQALPHRQPDRTYQTHAKLAVYDGHIDVNDLDRAFAPVTATWRRLPIILAGVGVFAGEPATQWLAVVPTTRAAARGAR